MKCSQCGGTKFITRSFLKEASTYPEFETRDTVGYSVFSGNAYKIDETAQVFGYQMVLRGDANGDIRIVGNCECYICEKCGHVELFAKSLIEKIHEKEIAEEAEHKKQHEIEMKLKKDYEELVELVDKIKKELPLLEKRVKDENISVKEHNAINAKLIWINRYLCDLEKLIADWDKEPDYSQKRWYSYQKNYNDIVCGKK